MIAALIVTVIAIVWVVLLELLWLEFDTDTDISDRIIIRVIAFVVSWILAAVILCYPFNSIALILSVVIGYYLWSTSLRVGYKLKRLYEEKKEDANV